MSLWAGIHGLVLAAALKREAVTRPSLWWNHNLLSAYQQIVDGEEEEEEDNEICQPELKNL